MEFMVRSLDFNFLYNEYITLNLQYLYNTLQLLKENGLANLQFDKIIL